MKLIDSHKVDVSRLIDWETAQSLFSIYPDVEMVELESFISEKKNSIIPIVIDESFRIIDGYNRVKACKNVGINEIWADIWHYESNDEMELHAICLNAKRRHLDSVTLARMALRLAELNKPSKEETIKKQRENAVNQHTKEPKFGEGFFDLLGVGEEEGSVPEGTKPTANNSIRDASKHIGVSHNTVRKVRKVDATGNQVLISAMNNKEISIDKASKLAGEEEEVIKHVIDKIKNPEKHEDTDSHGELLAAACLDCHARLNKAFEKLKFNNMREEEIANLESMLYSVGDLVGTLIKNIQKCSENKCNKGVTSENQIQ